MHLDLQCGKPTRFDFEENMKLKTTPSQSQVMNRLNKQTRTGKKSDSIKNICGVNEKQACERSEVKSQSSV